MNDNMDLYETLAAVISQALGSIVDAEAYELAHLLGVANTIRQQAIDVGEQRLKQESERLLYAVEQEIEDRGGDKYMSQERATSLEQSIIDLPNLSTTEIIQRLADIATQGNIGFDKKSLQEYTDASHAELKKRGVEVNVTTLTNKDFKSEAQELRRKKRKEKAIKKIPFPDDLTPNAIINAKTPKGIPNT